MSKLIHGKGINDAPYTLRSFVNGKRVICPFYMVWVSMLNRCYDLKLRIKKPSYVGCTVVEEWHSFMAFKSWMETQDWHGKQLDKDIMYPGNKLYSPKTCVFVSKRINPLIKRGRKRSVDLPIGVRVSKTKGKYESRLDILKVEKYLGAFDTVEEASNAYKTHKRLQLLAIACCEPDVRVKQGLYRHSELLRIPVKE